MAGEGKRTTVVRDEVDQRNLDFIARRFRCSDAEADRRAIRLTAQLLRMEEEDGTLVVLRPSGEKVLFVLL